MKNNFEYYGLVAEAIGIIKAFKSCIADPNNIVSVGQGSHGIEEENNSFMMKLTIIKTLNKYNSIRTNIIFSDH